MPEISPEASPPPLASPSPPRMPLPSPSTPSQADPLPIPAPRAPGPPRRSSTSSRASMIPSPSGGSRDASCRRRGRRPSRTATATTPPATTTARTTATATATTRCTTRSRTRTRSRCRTGGLRGVDVVRGGVREVILVRAGAVARSVLLRVRDGQRGPVVLVHRLLDLRVRVRLHDVRGVVLLREVVRTSRRRRPIRARTSAPPAVRPAGRATGTAMSHATTTPATSTTATSARRRRLRRLRLHRLRRRRRRVHSRRRRRHHRSRRRPFHSATQLARRPLQHIPRACRRRRRPSRS